MVARETNIVNAFETTLAAQLASGGTSMNLADDPGIDSPAYFVIDPDNDSNREVVLWSTGSNHAAATVTRDIDSKHGTDPTHAAGTTVRLAVVKQHIEEAHDAIQQGFILEDGDGDEVTIAPAVASGVYTQREVKFVEGGGIDIDWTDTDNGTDADPYDLTFTVSVTSSDIAAGTLVTESETITSNDNDTTIPTSAAVKNYADSEAATVTNKTLQDYAETKQVLTSSSGAVAVDLANGNVGTLTLTENVTVFNFTNVPSTFSTFQLYITQHASSNKTVAISTTVNGGGAANALTSGAGGYTVTTGANKVDIITFAFVGAATPHLSMLQDMRNS